jgi:hypothetical protein
MASDTRFTAVSAPKDLLRPCVSRSAMT